MEKNKDFKIIEKRVDESWKEGVEKEKSRDEAKQEASKTFTSEESEQQRQSKPQPEFEEQSANLFGMLISSLATQALVFMGEMPVDEAGNRVRDVERAKQTVDMLGMIKEKTEGNLSPQEAKAIEDVLYELRMKFVGVFK